MLALPYKQGVSYCAGKLPLLDGRSACKILEIHIMAENTQRSRGKRGPLAGTEEARRGGEAVRAKYGRDFFSRIGKKGGDTVRREHGSDFYAQIGRKGGESTKSRQGPDFYARIGKKGGESNRRETTEAHQQ